MKNALRASLPVILSVLAFGASAPLAFAADWYVDAAAVADGDGTSLVTATTTIQAAVDAASSDDTIIVAAGTYTEDVNINESVTLEGAQAGVNPNDGSWADTRTTAANESIIHGAVNLSLSNTITIDGFTIERAAGNEGHILIGGGQPSGVGITSQFTIQNNRIIGSRSTGTTWGGIHTNLLDSNPPGLYSFVGTSMTVENNRVEISGTASSNGILIRRLVPGTDNNSALSITGNYIGAIDPIPGDGISLQIVQTSTGLAQITGNHLVGSSIFLWRTGDANIANNEVISPMEDGISLGGVDSNITINDNSVTGGTVSGINVDNVIGSGANSGITITDNTLQGNAYGLYVAAGSVTDTVEVHTNTITGNTTNGVFNDPSSGGSVDATNNWWGASTGPTHASNIGGTGDAVTDNVTFDPWYTNAIMTTLSGTDTTPDVFTFIDQIDVALNATVVSNAIVVAGIDSPTAISIVGGSYSINGAATTTASGTVNVGDSVQVQHTSSASNSTAVDSVLTIGGVSDTFISTTVAIGTHTLTYTAGANGSLTGILSQTVNSGANGTAVTAVADSDFSFTSWSDGSTANPRTDTSVTGSVTVTANFEANSSGGNSGSRPNPVTPTVLGATTVAGCVPGSGHLFDVTNGQPCAVGATSATTVTTTTSTGTTFNFTRYLVRGSRGADVTALQQFLISSGYSIPAGATGYFGVQTRAAVMAFQRDRDLPQVGVVGPLTRAQLNK